MDTQNKLFRQAAIPSAVMALLLMTTANANAARPTTPDACRHIAEWRSTDHYGPESCVNFKNRVWAADRFAHPGQRPGADHPIYFGHPASPMAKLWFDIGAYTPP
ncbi:hypothetical protein [Cupriavidus pauculus]|uniref:hypothetical protein n=1 Tax=Cupriavidus pauculus TaxID=82633 RepID=UPI001EE15EFF|nr:hypothetical protein [Cupriavidus pauculus]GJG98357.1 hypothetical protein CBA19C6_27730 [Cupriavidus pauculus]